MAKKPTHQELLGKFLSTFEKGKPFTKAEIRMNGIKLGQLKKDVKAYKEEMGIEKPVEVIISEAIDYASIMNCKFRSVSSLGYDILRKSVEYWAKREKTLEMLEKQKEEENKLESYESVGVKNNERKANDKSKPAWYTNDEDDW